MENKQYSLLKAVMILAAFAGGFASRAQVVTTNPAVPSPSQAVTISFDVTGTDFAAKDLDDVWLWAWLENGATDVNAPTNVNPATSAQDAAKVTRSAGNPNLYSITITATAFFDKPASEIATVGVLLKGRDWSDGQTADKFIEFTETFSVGFATPVQPEFFVNEGEAIDIEANTNEAASIVLKVGNSIIASSPGPVTTFSHSHQVTETTGSVTVTAEADNGSETSTASFTYVLRTPAVDEARPAGIIDGINYAADPAIATLSLWAPGKSSVYVLGDFNEWRIDPGFQMKRDGEHFWIELKNLTPGSEYAFQYLVDETLKIADPYADKILDPDDQYIPESAYPGLKPFPAEARSDQWYFNRLAVLQTGQEPFEWVAADFAKPARHGLVIYELLIRDFFGDQQKSYQNLTDTLGYLKRLGVNAIELMPVMEFNGNESWGYNPTFMFAPDKFYGTKNDLKDFVDACHQQGLAVILDIAMNHHDMPNPYVMMDFDFVNGKPEADNKWFNTDATHPFNVFFDMNHESEYTRKYLDTVNYYWLNEFKVDGFRFDLSKGFTQTNNPSNVSAWSAYDASRIATLKRMADRIWEHSPDAYIILEHLSVNTEEKELAEYRADEGKGMMLWGKMTDPYNQLTMGYEENSDISGVNYKTRGWTVPHLVSYMESHDEERLMVKNIFYGNQSGDYSVKDTLVALSRVRAAATMFFTVPGPKMLWQFGELGYDYSINHCPDGSINENCRVSPKPVPWNYAAQSHRRWLYDHIRDLNRLRSAYDVFTSGSVTMTPGSTLTPQIMIKNNPYNPAPVDPGEMNVVVVANFDVISRDIDVVFPHTGTWYDYYGDGLSLDVAGSSAEVALAPGAYRMYTDVPVESTVVTALDEFYGGNISIYPNPVEDVLTASGDDEIFALSLFTRMGSKVPADRIAERSWYIGHLKPGLYLAEVRTRRGIIRMKLIKK